MVLHNQAKRVFFIQNLTKNCSSFWKIIPSSIMLPQCISTIQPALLAIAFSVPLGIHASPS